MISMLVLADRLVLPPRRVILREDRTPAEGKWTHDVLGQLRYVLAFVVLPNAFFWVSKSLLTGAPAAWINVDYAVAGLIALLIPSWLAFTLLSLMFVLEILVTSSTMYYFSRPDWYLSAKYVFDLPMGQVLPRIAALLVISSLVCFGVWKSKGKVNPEKRGSTAACLLAAIVLIAMTRLPGKFAEVKSGDAASGVRIAFSSTARLVNAMIGGNASKQTPRLTNSGAVVVSGIVKDAFMHRRNLVLILAESYGELQDENLSEVVMAPLLSNNVLSHYEVSTGKVTFSGPTVSGELRELCGIDGGVGTTLRASGLADICLPKIAEANGYTSTAYHGFYGRMFGRDRWYRELGFSRILFLDNLEYLPKCGHVFRGVCDGEIAKMVEEQLSRSTSAQFVYWVTLNSHLPIDLSSKTKAEVGCDGFNDAATSALCVWSKIIRNVNHDIAQIATSEGITPTDFLIVGDHAPPFLSKGLRQRFNQSEVPYIYLTPRTADRKRESHHVARLSHGMATYSGTPDRDN